MRGEKGRDLPPPSSYCIQKLTKTMHVRNGLDDLIRDISNDVLRKKITTPRNKTITSKTIMDQLL